MKRKSPTSFYNHFVNEYHLLFPHWDDYIQNQGRMLQKFIRKNISVSKDISLLDCSCGIGAQTIGLALQGYKIIGSDISSSEIRRAQKDAKRLGAPTSFFVADFKELGKVNKENFDLILSFDNAISHMKNLSQLKKAFTSMRDCLRPKGTLLLSVRDYDHLRIQKPIGTPPRTINDQYGTRIVVQTWDWNKLGDAYDLTLFILQKKGRKWKAQVHGPVSMRAFNRKEVDDTLKSCGARKIKWFSPKESGYYQPVVMVRF